jgi:hypothetical protein
MSDLSCRGIRELLGVYVLGAIDPAERGVVDGHLSYCHDCREELAGLAGLPALLRRVPMAEAERLASPGARAGDFDDPQPELLTSVLRRVADRRRTRRVRTIFAAAAALLIAVGGGAVVTHSLAPQQVTGPASFADVAHASGNGLTVTVRYGKSNWGTEMWVQANGIAPGTTCKFWVVTKDGRRLIAGGWTVGSGADPLWYPADISVPAASLTGFLITSGGSTLLRIPAAT